MLEGEANQTVDKGKVTESRQGRTKPREVKEVPQEVQCVAFCNQLRGQHPKFASEEGGPSHVDGAACGDAHPLVHRAIKRLVVKVADRGVVEGGTLGHRAKDLDSRLEMEGISAAGGEKGEQGADSTLEGGRVERFTGGPRVVRVKT